MLMVVLSIGAIAAFGVGLLTCLAGYRFAIVLVTFFLTSSKLTKFKAERKKQLEDGYQEGWCYILQLIK